MQRRIKVVTKASYVTNVFFVPKPSFQFLKQNIIQTGTHASFRIISDTLERHKKLNKYSNVGPKCVKTSPSWTEQKTILKRRKHAASLFFWDDQESGEQRRVFSVQPTACTNKRLSTNKQLSTDPYIRRSPPDLGVVWGGSRLRDETISSLVYLEAVFVFAPLIWERIPFRTVPYTTIYGLHVDNRQGRGNEFR